MPYTTKDLVSNKSKLENEPDFDPTPQIAEAQARIDAKLRKRYKVPFVDPVPPIICSIATNFAAGFAIERDYSNRREKDEPYLAEVLIKRAEADLAEVLEQGLLDGLPGVDYVPPPAAHTARGAVLSTPNTVSEMGKVLSEWVL